MVLFLIVYRIVDIVVMLLALCQWLYTLITGDANESLSRFARGLGMYVKQMIDYISYNAEQKPYPFSDWPDVPSADHQSEDESSMMADKEDTNAPSATQSSANRQSKTSSKNESSTEKSEAASKADGDDETKQAAS